MEAEQGQPQPQPYISKRKKAKWWKEQRLKQLTENLPDGNEGEVKLPKDTICPNPRPFDKKDICPLRPLYDFAMEKAQTEDDKLYVKGLALAVKGMIETERERTKKILEETVQKKAQTNSLLTLLDTKRQ